MKTEAYYRISDHYISKNFTTISFKIDNLNFAINFYCPTPGYVCGKFIGTNVLKELVKKSTYISLKDSLSNYVFNHFYGQLINISENEILIKTIIKLREVLISFKYDTEIELAYQTHVILYNKIWENENKTTIQKQ